MVKRPPKPTVYYLKYGDPEIEHELTTDPRGWQDNSVGVSRDENFGLNTENVVGLSFANDGRDAIKTLYEAKGAYAKCSVIIEKRQNDWTLADFYTYRLDFKTYKDNGYFVEISGTEESLLNKVQKFADTEYEIDIPTSNKQFLSYTGITVYKKNLLQCLYGAMPKHSSLISGNNDTWCLEANRSVRTYTNVLSFTTSDGVPYETMTMRALTYTGVFSLRMNLYCTVIGNGTLRNPASGHLILVKHDSSFQNGTIVVVPSSSSGYISALYTSASASKRKDVFKYNQSFDISLNAGQLLSVFYIGDGALYDGASMDEGTDCYIETGTNTPSPYQNQNLEVFTFEWAIEQWLKKVYPNVSFSSEVTYPNVTPVLSATPLIAQMGSLNATGVLKYKLSDMLKALDCLCCIGIDISGNNFTIKNREDMYDYTYDIVNEVYTDLGYEIDATDVVVEHDDSHQFKKITVGTQVDEKGEDDDLIYPFIVEKEFETIDSEFDGELSLVNPFMVDPYDIDNYIKKITSDAQTQDKCDFVVLCCDLIYSTERLISNGLNEQNTVSNTTSQPIQVQSGVSVVITPSMRYSISKVGCFVESIHQNQFLTPIGYVVTFEYDQGEVETFTGINTPPSSIFKTTANADTSVNVEITYIQNYELLENTTTFAEVSISPVFEFYSDTQLVGFDLYRDHTIDPATFTGNVVSVYNIPYTPKRTLMEHSKYLAVSLAGNETNGKLKFLTSTFKNSAIKSKCDYESVEVEEETDYKPTNPLFAPKLIKFSAYKAFNGIDDFNSRKYKLVKVNDKKHSKTYYGWIKDITFALGRNKKQEWVLQAKNI